jgi:hypothetical protein
MTFHRPCHRSSSASIAYDIAHAIAATIGCHRVFHRWCSIPSHSPERWKRSRVRIPPGFERRSADAALTFKTSRQAEPKTSTITAERPFRRVANQGLNTSLISLGTCDRVRWPASVHPSVDIPSTAAVPCSALAAHCYQQSASLLASGTKTVVSNQLSAIHGSRFSHWECHGKSDHRRNARIPAKRLDWRFRPRFLRLMGVRGRTVASRYIDLPCPYTAALTNSLSCHFVSRRIGARS